MTRPTTLSPSFESYIIKLQRQVDFLRAEQMRQSSEIRACRMLWMTTRISEAPEEQRGGEEQGRGLGLRGEACCEWVRGEAPDVRRSRAGLHHCTVAQAPFCTR